MADQLPKSGLSDCRINGGFGETIPLQPAVVINDVFRSYHYTPVRKGGPLCLCGQKTLAHRAG